MTLRVELKIIPFGVESDEYIIKTFNISNKGQVNGDLYKYIIEEDCYKTGNGILIEHYRKEGAEVLARKCLEKLGY